MRKQLNGQPKNKAARLAFLLKWAAVRKNSLLSPREVRERFQSRPWRPRVKACWCCFRVAKLVRHHVIQIQHGGSNEGGNIVMICDWCHVEVHPWMQPPDDHPVVRAVREMDGVDE
jgi:5-methylcytosine-specific restriction endonuclease McrA